MPPECLVCSPSVYGHTPRAWAKAPARQTRKSLPRRPKRWLGKNFFPGSILFYKPPCFSASRLISLLPTLPPGAPAFYPRRAVAHQPLAMPDAHGLLMPEEAAARNMGNTKPAFGKKKVSIAIKKYQKCLFDKKKNVLLPYLTTNKNDKKTSSSCATTYSFTFIFTLPLR